MEKPTKAIATLERYGENSVNFSHEIELALLWIEKLEPKNAEACALCLELGRRLKRIAEIIESVDNRCMAADGPVALTLDEMTQEEISEIYKLAK